MVCSMQLSCVHLFHAMQLISDPCSAPHWVGYMKVGVRSAIGVYRSLLEKNDLAGRESSKLVLGVIGSMC